MSHEVRKKVAVFGAGISGLSAAHELVQKGYKVSVYEKFLEAGGVARSYRETPSSVPSEYSWRGYAGGIDYWMTKLYLLKFTQNSIKMYFLTYKSRNTSLLSFG